MSKLQRIAVISDIHGCIDELIELHKNLQWLSLDEIWSIGDIIDRGPDSGACVQFCLDNNIKSVLGNHEDNIIGPYENFKKTGKQSRNKDKQKTISQLKDHHVEWFKTLPRLHVIDNLNLVLVHGGLYPSIPLYAQPINVIRLNMVNPAFPGKTRWWGQEANYHPCGKTEEESRSEGFERWYRVYDHEQDVIFGHSTWAQPMIYQNKGYGRCIGVDTGSCFGGSVTAAIYSASSLSFISVKCKTLYYPDAHRAFNEG